jgi:two-component system, chemotaxis family, chemotaxis protein CheY
LKPPAPKKILVVDDDEAQANLIATFLKKNQFLVATANDPLAALQLLQHAPVDLVITDLMMPHVDGIDFTERVHQLPGLKDVPVILITAWPSEEVSDKGMRRGVAMTLSKPVQLSKLLDLVGFATSG